MAKKNWAEFYISKGRFHLLPHNSFKKLLRYLKETQSRTVLDLGCGEGRHLVALAEQGYDVHGVDFAPAAVDIAQKWLMEKKLPGRASIADIQEGVKHLDNGSYDAIIAINSLNFLSLENFKRNLSEVNRILRTSGVFFLVIPSKDTPNADVETEQLSFTREDLENKLTDKFEIEEIDTDELNSFVVVARER